MAWQATKERCIRFDPQTGRYQARVRKMRQGIRSPEKKTICPTLDAAIEERDRLIRWTESWLDQRLGCAPVLEASTPIDLFDLGLRWLDEKAADPDIRPSTMTTTEGDLKNHILPQLGHIRPNELARHHIVDWVTQYANVVDMADGTPYAHPTCQRWWRILKQFLRDMQLGDCLHRVKGPRRWGKAKRELRTLPQEMVRDLLIASLEVVPDRSAEIWQLATTGMRPGEMYALRRDDLDRGRGCWPVERAHWHGIMDETKTRKPRLVPALPFLIERVDAHWGMLMREQDAQRIQSAWLYPRDRQHLNKGASPAEATSWLRSGNGLRTAFRKCRTALGTNIRLGPQVMRRTVNTLMFGARGDFLDEAPEDNFARSWGAQNVLVIQQTIGHSSMDMSVRYAGAMLGAQKLAMERALGREVIAL